MSRLQWDRLSSPPNLAVPGSALLLVVVIGTLQRYEAQINNYPAPISRLMQCSVPNYRYYRVTPVQARGFAETDTLTCNLLDGKPDGCMCVDPIDCKSGYCIPDSNGVGRCKYPIVQIAEMEFWRRGQRVNTAKIPDDVHDAFRLVNGVDVPQTWGVWELEFYSDTSCQNRVVGGVPIASSQRAKGFGHSIDHTAPYGSHDTPRTYWQDTHERPLEKFQLHGPAEYAFDGDLKTNWWAACENPCRARNHWLGLEFPEIVEDGVKCIRIIQDKDRDYASFSLIAQGRRNDTGVWEQLTQFNAATWSWGGVWEQLSIPQGVAFLTSTGHARLLDFDLNSSAVEIIGTHIVFDFGVETEIDSWRWATAEEPTENIAQEHDGYTCDRDGHCPRDPVQWTLEGSLDTIDWVMINEQDASYRVTVHRKRWLPFLSVVHQVSFSIEDAWPDGRGKCAARR